MMIRKLLFIFLISFSFIYPQTYKYIKVSAVNRTDSIKVLVKSGLQYYSLKDFCKITGLNYRVTPDLFQLQGKSVKVTFYKNNSFISLEETTPKVLQLPVEAIVTGENDFYVPSIYSDSYLSKVISSTVTLSKWGLVLGGELKLPDAEVKPDDKIKSAVPSKFDITSLELSPKLNGVSVKLSSKKMIEDHRTSYKNQIVTLQLKGVSVDTDSLLEIIPAGLITKIESKNFPKYAEIKFYVTDEYDKGEVLYGKESKELTLTFHNKKLKEAANKAKDKWNFDVIVIDAGHGGKDAGAVGVNGVKEKNVNLDVALKLGKLIEKNLSGVKVVYTRSKDNFVELYKRGKIANDKGGKLFISIHCNSTPEIPSNASGTEVYLLRPGRTAEAIKIAERENSVIKYEENPNRYQKLTDENFILVSMAQSAYMKYSEKFSEYLHNHFDKNLSISSRGIKQAGFLVLVGASMPSVLIETGFLSNKKDAEILGSEKGRSQIAASIFESVKSFKEYYDEQLKE